MSNKKSFDWTSAQRTAIDAEGKRILVSAAAGSGKSTVLTERIINSVTEKRYDLSRLLIVTFTKDSAEDLKDKITNELSRRVRETPSDTYLYKQLMKLPSAMINTIDGACFSYIKKYFDKLGLPASVSVIDENLAASLRTDTMNKFIEYCYSGKFEAIPNFDAFAEIFVTEKDDSLAELFLKLYSKLENLPNGFDDFKKISAVKNGDEFLASPFGKLLTLRLRAITDYFISNLTDAVEYAKNGNKYEKFLTDFSDALHYMKNIDTALADGNFKALYHFTGHPPKKPTGYVKTDKTEIGELYLKNTKSIDALVTEWYKKIFSFTDNMFCSYSRLISAISENIYDFLSEFHKRFSQVKLRRGNIDFDDLKHYAIKLFFNSDGSISDIAHEISSQLQEIYIDECQDLNPLQNKIFEALSVNCPMFMVGDIKQSIYGFRGADSSFFADCKKSFPIYDKSKDYKDATVFLSENFRSTSNILNFANIVSDAMFFAPESKDGLFDFKIPYTKDDRLSYGRGEPVQAPPVTILNCSTDSKNKLVTEKVSTDLEAEMVANEIYNLIKSGANPNDIAILMRKASSDAPIYEKKLRSKNIPVYTKKGVPLFDTPEVQLALCLLNCCDNPYRDIFLAGALRSPVFGFTLDEMIKMRQESPKAASLYEALCEYTQKNDFQKGNDFIRFLNKIKKFAMNNPVDRILWEIYSETSFFSLIYDGTVSEDEANVRRSNLLALRDMAKQMATTGQNGLFAFIEKIRILIEEDKSPVGAITASDGVKIMTVHASKGLEFKYCFLVSASSSFSIKDKQAPVIFNKELGFTASIKDNRLLSKTSTPFSFALLLNMEFEWREEEMRTLYVALTRAKYKLYITSSEKNFDNTLKELEILASYDHPYNFIRTSSLIKWILLALKRHSDISAEYDVQLLSQQDIINNAKKAIPLKNDTQATNDTISTEDGLAIYKELNARMSYSYPHLSALRLPSKLSVSRLYPEILDEKRYFGATDIINEQGELIDLASTQNSLSTTQNNASKLKQPDFMLEKHLVTPAEKGTATHIFMQFCDFEYLEKNGIEAETKRLIEKKFILPTHADVIDKNAICNFIKTDIYGEMKNASQLRREYRFNIKLCASDFTADDALKKELKDEEIFVQGIIDCYFRNANGKITLLDYKTDYVPSDILGDKEKEDLFFISKHSRQLKYYSKAIKILTGKEVDRTVIYSFSLGRCIEL